jgi:hypothetical protein
MHWYSHAKLSNGINYMNRGVTFACLEDGLAKEVLVIEDTEILNALFFEKDGAKAS